MVVSPLILAFPPVGCASSLPQTLQVTLFVAWLKISCSLPHFGHFTRRKALVGLGMSLFHSAIVFVSLVTVLLVFGVVCRLCVLCSRRLCI